MSSDQTNSHSKLTKVGSTVSLSTIGGVDNALEWTGGATSQVRDADEDIAHCWRLLESPSAPTQSNLGAGNSKDQAVGENVLAVESPNDGETSLSLVKRFIPQKNMGVGAFGVVIHVYDHLLRRDLALKFLRPSRGKSPRFISRFLREARAVAALEHQGIVRVFETGEIAGHPYMAVELVDGPNLAEFLRDHKRPSIAQSVWLIRKIAEAVHFAHSRGVLHRDLKPSNILLAPATPSSSEGLGYSPRLTDFGLAKRIDPSSGQPDDLTNEKQVVGTVRYMSPEQASGKLTDIATASDQFSLGIILFELITGKNPFEADTEAELLRRIRNDQPTRPRKLAPRMSSDLEAVILKSLEKDPKDRYRTLDEFSEDLSRFETGAPVSASHYSYRRQIIYWCRQSPVSAISVTAVALGFLLALFLISNAWRSERNSLRREKETYLRAEAAKLGEIEALKIARSQKDTYLRSINTLFFDLMEKINDGTPIPHQERIALLNQALELHQEMSPQGERDRNSTHLYSVAFHHLGNALFKVGDFPRVIEARKKTIALLDELLLETPDHKKLLFQKSIALFHLATVQLGSIDIQSGIDNVDQSLLIMRELASQFPDDVDVIDGLNNIELYVAQNRYEPGSSVCVDLLQRVKNRSIDLWEANSDRPIFAKHGVFAIFYLAEVYYQQGNYVAMRMEHQAGQSLFDRAFGEAKDEPWVKVIHRTIVRTTTLQILKMGDWNELKQLSLEGLRLEEETMDLDRREVSVTYQVLFMKMHAIAARQLKEDEETFAAIVERAEQLEREYSSCEYLKASLEPIKIYEDLKVGASALSIATKSK